MALKFLNLVAREVRKVDDCYFTVSQTINNQSNVITILILHVRESNDLVKRVTTLDTFNYLMIINIKKFSLPTKH